MKTSPAPGPGWEAFSRWCSGKEAVPIAFLLPFHTVPGKNAGKPGETGIAASESPLRKRRKSLLPMSSEDYLSALRKRSETASGVACRCAVSGFIFSEKAAISASHAFSGLSPSSPNRASCSSSEKTDVPAVRQWRRPRKTFCPSTPPRSGHRLEPMFPGPAP